VKNLIDILYNNFGNFKRDYEGDAALKRSISMLIEEKEAEAYMLIEEKRLEELTKLSIQAEQGEKTKEIENYFNERDVKNCVIKGNIGYNTGEKIYHLPGCECYDATIIDERYGEKWFCTEKEAISAGWRKAYTWKVPIFLDTLSMGQLILPAVHYSGRYPFLRTLFLQTRPLAARA